MKVGVACPGGLGHVVRMEPAARAAGSLQVTRQHAVLAAPEERQTVVVPGGEGAVDMLPHMRRMQQQLAGMRQVLQALSGTTAL